MLSTSGHYGLSCTPASPKANRFFRGILTCAECQPFIAFALWGSLRLSDIVPDKVDEPHGAHHFLGL